MKIPLILIDSRETTPWEFKGYRSKSTCLKVGDYTLLGYTKLIAVERKSLIDFAGCIRKWKKFEEGQIAKLKKVRYRCIIVEGDPSIGQYNKYTDPFLLVAGACDIILQDVSVLFCGTRDMAELACYQFMVRAKNLVDSA